MNRVQFTMLLLWLGLPAVFTQNLSIEELMTSLSCKEKTCSKACGNEYRYFQDTYYTCQCDADCVEYGDCCQDFDQFCRNDTRIDTRIPMEYMTCRETPILEQNLRYFWMIGKCPTEFKDPVVKDRCENALSAPITNVPIKVGESNLTYANIYCAYCHSITPENFTILAWKVAMKCRRNLKKVDNSEIDDALSKCELLLRLPSLPPRPCLQPWVIGECTDVVDSKNYPTFFERCMKYQLLVIINDNIYKNPDCAMCSLDSESLESLECYFQPLGPLLEIEYGDEGGTSSSGRLTFNMLFNFNKDGTTLNIDGRDIIQDEQSCDGMDEVYDRILQVCTKLHCPQGTIAINGSCMSQNYTTRNYSLSAVYQQDNLNETFIRDISQNWVREIDGTSCHVRVENFTEPPVNNSLDTVNTAVLFDVDLFSNCSLRDLVNATIRFISRLPIPTQSMEVYLTTSRTFQCDIDKNQMVSLEEFISNHSIRLEYFNMRVDFLFNEEQTVNGTVCFNKDFLSGLDCPSVEYLPDQFVKRKDSLKLIESGLILPSDQFIIHEDKAYVCLKYTQEIWMRRMRDLMSNNRILEYSVIGTSVICCILTLVVYTMLPQLRNTPGKIVMSLTLSIAVAQSITLILTLPSGFTCIMVAGLGHSQWLSVFLWMSMMAIDIARSLHQGMTVSKSGNKTYLLYAIMAWGCPLVAVGILVVLDHYGYVGMKYGSGSLCWIGSDKMLLYTLIIPIATCILVNLGCFVVVIVAIKPDTKLLAKSSYAQRKKQMAKVFAKLSVLTGFTWVVMYLAVVFNGEVLWCMNIVLNGSSGLYIFVCFVCNTRTLTMLKEKFFLKSRSPSTYISTNSTT